jgi:ribonuclease HII
VPRRVPLPVPSPPSFLDDAEVIIASDEAGLGAWAGGLVVSVVAAPKDWVPRVTILTDSKKMTPEERVLAAKAIQDDDRIRWATMYADSRDIDAGNVYKVNVQLHTLLIASQLRMAAVYFPGKKAVAVVDGTMKIPGARSLPKADQRVVACSAASVLAKVTRDTWLIEDAKVWPGYGFENHKGYGGDEKHQHTMALEKLGPCPIHRRSFGPIKRLLKKREHQDVLDLMAELNKEGT